MEFNRFHFRLTFIGTSVDNDTYFICHVRNRAADFGPLAAGSH
jgi:hypothetical protein